MTIEGINHHSPNDYFKKFTYLLTNSSNIEGTLD